MARSVPFLIRTFQFVVVGVAALNLIFSSHAPAANQVSTVSSANDAKNLARANCGAHITWISSQGIQYLTGSGAANPATNLALDDNTLNCELATGDNTLLVSLPTISNLDRLTFINEKRDLAGAVQIFVSDYRLSPNNSKWTSVGRPLTFGKERFVSVPLAGVEAKYVKVLFKTNKPGTIAGVGLYGQRTLAAFADQQHRAKAVAARLAYNAVEPHSRNNLNFNFANLYARARVVWVSSGSKVTSDRMIDDDPTTGYDFAPNDPHPTAIIELSTDERLRRVSAIYNTERGQLDIYLLNDLSDPGQLDRLKPAVSIPDNAGAGKAAAEFDPRGARYIALRWTPAGQNSTQQNFEIAEIGAFSDAVPTILDVQGIPEITANASALNLPKPPPVLVPTSP
jgi:hypothetical protein